MEDIFKMGRRVEKYCRTVDYCFNLLKGIYIILSHVRRNITVLSIMSAHLTQKAKEALELGIEDRIDYILGDRWIGYTKSREVLDKLEFILRYPRKKRMPNMLIIGDTNNGKTALVSRFEQLHQPFDDPETEELIFPVLSIQAPPVPDESRFYNTILEKLSAPYRSRDLPAKKEFQTLRMLKRLKTKILIIDEIHHIIAGTMMKQRHFLNTIKYLSNELQMSIVGVGIKDAYTAIQTDPQLSNRFTPLILPKWELNNEYLRLLASFERMVPLKKPSNLIETNLATKILSLSEGAIGEIAGLITMAAHEAIKNGDEIITLKLVNSVDWIPPSERKKLR